MGARHGQVLQRDVARGQAAHLQRGRQARSCVWSRPRLSQLETRHCSGHWLERRVLQRDVACGQVPHLQHNTTDSTACSAPHCCNATTQPAGLARKTPAHAKGSPAPPAPRAAAPARSGLQQAAWKDTTMSGQAADNQCRAPCNSSSMYWPAGHARRESDLTCECKGKLAVDTEHPATAQDRHQKAFQLREQHTSNT